MKIFYPVEVFYPSQAGGAANSVYWLAKHLSKHGFEPRIVATNKGITDQVQLNRWLETDAGRAIFVKTRFLHVPIFQTVTSLRHFLNADVVHLSSVFFPTAFITAFAAKLFRRRIAWSPRGELASVALGHSAGRKRPILWSIKKLIGSYAVFHSTSDEETMTIRKIFGPAVRIYQIPNYVELEPQAPRRDGNYILFMGRMHPQKAVDNLIRALTVSEKFMRSDLVLKIAGRERAGNVRPLRQLVVDLNMQDRVEFVGQVEGGEKLHLLADAHVTVLPSHAENFGVVVVESLAQGTPVIASRGTPWESLEKEKVGFWVDNSPKEFAKAIDRFLEMPAEEYAEYRGRGRDFVKRQFDISSHIGEWLEFYGRFRTEARQ
jgi:glycosyltransferase involved in cell wall biosynthesis